MKHWALASAFALLAACGQPEVPVGSDLRIVSLNPCADAILAEIAPGKLAAVSHYSHDPRSASMDVAEARRWPATGGTAEEVITFAPDMVVASSFLAPSTRQALENAGLRIETVGIVGDIEAARQQVRDLAVVAQEVDAGEALVAEMDAALEVATHDGAPASALFWQSGGIVPGEETLIADILSRTGYSSHSAARGLGQGAYLPLEQVLADPPEIVIAAGGERALNHPVLRRLDGVQYARIDPALTYCGGPTVVRLAERLAEIRDAALKKQ